MTTGTLADYEQLLPDERVWRIREKLGRELKLPDAVDFATFIVPERWGEQDGIAVLHQATVVFAVVSPNPHKRLSSENIMTEATTRLEWWREKEDEVWRFVHSTDPAERIFRALCIQHLEARKNYSELN